MHVFLRGKRGYLLESDMAEDTSRISTIAYASIFLRKLENISIIERGIIEIELAGRGTSRFVKSARPFPNMRIPSTRESQFVHREVTAGYIQRYR
jgi:hypothetical protein